MPGFMEMDSEGTEAFLGRLAGTAADLRAAWGTAAGRIGAGEAGIGSDRLAAAFDAPYRAGADPVRAATDALLGRYDGMCAAGRSCVTAYLAADRRSAAALPQAVAS
jgi:hypothetical protein